MNRTVYNGYELIEDEFDGRQYLLLLPKEEAFGKPWVWRVSPLDLMLSGKMAICGGHREPT